MHPTQEAMEKLAQAGFLTKTGTDPNGDTTYGISDEQAPRLMAILKRPSSWDESPVLSACKRALQALREQAIQQGEFER